MKQILLLVFLLFLLIIYILYNIERMTWWPSFAPETTRDDHGSGISTATRMWVDDIVDGDIETTDNVDYFSFHGEADWQYVIETILGTSDDTKIALYQPHHPPTAGASRSCQIETGTGRYT